MEGRYETVVKVVPYESQKGTLVVYESNRIKGTRRILVNNQSGVIEGFYHWAIETKEIPDNRKLIYGNVTFREDNRYNRGEHLRYSVDKAFKEDGLLTAIGTAINDFFGIIFAKIKWEPDGRI
ncbi:MAG: hypothetical protein PHH54_06960 [Candidatus Nanoarchaeia archaeon]|nr:hypothetical protein [Candidatus Nanoarchaeia archaeon]MDD5741695.1 hypothetical protein [Candidatus Nanoarchaeia archaeon]